MTHIVRVVLMLDVEAEQKEEGAAKRAAEAHILEHLQPLIEQHAWDVIVASTVLTGEEPAEK
jgi:hypothetical protein